MQRSKCQGTPWTPPSVLLKVSDVLFGYGQRPVDAVGIMTAVLVVGFKHKSYNINNIIYI
jgi:hypothetical protein